MPEALRKRLGLASEDQFPAAEFELTTASEAMSAFEQTCFAIPASGAFIAVRDATSLHCVASLGNAPELGSRLPPDFGMALECLETGSVVFRHLSDDAQRVLSVGMSMEGVSRARSAVAVPMRASGAIVGLIAVFSLRDSSIQPGDITALDRIADFWGPLMADEWFPDGIPASIAGDAAAFSPASEVPLVVQDEPAAPYAPDAPFVEAELLALAAQEVARLHGEPAATMPTAPVPAATIPTSTPPIAADAGPVTLPEVFEIPDSLAPVDRPPLANRDELPDDTKTAMSAEAGIIAEVAKAPESPVFLAPPSVDFVPLDIHKHDQWRRFAWLIVVAAFFALLLFLWYLKSLSSDSGATPTGSVSASINGPATTGAPAANSSNTAPAPIAAARESDEQLKSPREPDGSANKLASPAPARMPPTNRHEESASDARTHQTLPDRISPLTPQTQPNPPPSQVKPKYLAQLKPLYDPPSNSTSPDPDSNGPTPSSAAANTTSPSPTPPAPTATEESAEPDAASASATPAPEPAPPINPAGFQSPTFALAQTLKAHSGWVSSLAFSSSGNLASGSWDRSVKFWDLATGHETRALSDKLKQVQSVAFTHDGKLLAVEDASDTVTIFDASTGARLRELSTDKSVPSVGISWVYSIAFSPDGRWLASAVDDKTIRIWDVSTGAKIRDLTGAHRPILYAAFSPLGQLLATGNDDKSIQIWNVASGAPATKLSGHKKVINAVAFSPDGKYLASASGDKTIKLWNAATGEKIRTLSGHRAAVSSISFSADGRWLASGSWDKTVKVWNVATGKEVQTLHPDARAIYAVSFDPHDRWLAAGSEDGALEIWRWNAAANSNSAPANP